jgi:hypothetical protein
VSFVIRGNGANPTIRHPGPVKAIPLQYSLAVQFHERWDIKWRGNMSRAYSGVLVAVVFACSSSTEHAPGTAPPDGGVDTGSNQPPEDASVGDTAVEGASGDGGVVGSSGSGGTAGTADSGGSGSGGAGGGLNCSSSSNERCLCSPTTSPPANASPTCNPVSVNGYCCADQGFPSSGICSCRRWTCEETSSDCNCGSSSTGSGSRCLKNWTTCCMYTVGTASTCFCDNFNAPCDPGWLRVPSCTIDRVPCGASEHPIATCDRIEGGPDGSSGSGGVGGGTGGTGGTGGAGNDGGPAPCTGMSCGVDRGVTCGTCGPVQYCADDHTCRAACVGKTCGDDHGVPCGTCPSNHLCNDQQIACVPRVCTPNQIGCDINYRATCNASGTGFLTRLENCRTSELVCYLGSCGTHAVEDVARYGEGSLTLAVNAYWIGNFYEVTVNRKLTGLAALFYTGPGNLNWVVLELGATPIERLNLPAAVNPDTEGFSSSGPINVDLAAGKTYFIGFVNDFTFQAQASYEQRSAHDLTFGRAIGGVASHVQPSAPTTTGQLFTQRLTTDAP